MVGHKKRGTLLWSICSPIINRFLQFFHWHTLQAICYNVIITYSTTHKHFGKIEKKHFRPTLQRMVGMKQNCWSNTV